MIELLRFLCFASLFSSLTVFSKIHRGIIIGSGRIGSHLYESNQRTDFLLRRNDPFPINNFPDSCPIYVCTRNDDLEEVILKTPETRRKDLIFLQNGVLIDLLKKHQLEDNTQALIYYGIAKKDDPAIDGKTELNPEGLTCVTGKWAEDFAERMRQANLSCKILSKKEWSQAMVRQQQLCSEY